ncbi:MAG: NAD(P)/FAD-dependent oxidoreductase [Bacteroidota bacterium]
MNRKDFLKNFATLAVATPFMSTLLASCSKKGIDFYPEMDVNFNGKIIIIGAGAAGLIAGHILNKYGIDFQIIEASSVFGGRVKKIDGFADFPIDLGAEWIHTDPSILAKLLNDPTVDANIETIVYNPATVSVWKNGKLRKRNFASNFYSEYKFKRTTWYDFFDQFIVPNISDKIIYNSPITKIDYSGDKVVMMDNNNNTYEADKVISTTSLTILKDNLIDFQPSLPADKVNALDQVDFPDGIKVFIEFSERFYPDMTNIGGLLTAGDTIYYDAAFKKDSDKNILGLFSVSDTTSDYTDLSSDEEIINKVLGELDEIFNGKASETYIKHVIQNWSKEPYIRGSYSHYDDYDAVDILQQPLDGKVYFAGEAFGGDAQSTVHGAGETAYRVLEEILRG